MTIEGPLKGVRQEGRSRRARAKKEQSTPEVAFCHNCTNPFTSDLDVQWWNADDPSDSGWVCTACWLALTQARKDRLESEKKGAAQESIVQNTEQAIIHMREQVRALHVHKWTFLQQMLQPVEGGLPITTYLFYCSECPYDNPVFKEMQPERIGP